MKRPRIRRSRVMMLGAILVLLLVAIGVSFFVKPAFFPSMPNSERTVKVCDERDDECHETGLPYQNAALPIEARVADLMNRMTMAEKIGQMALIEKNSIRDPQDIAKYGLGALLSGSGGKPDDNTPEGWLRMINAFQQESRKTRLRIPLLYGVDANHGHSNVPGATIFPHAIGLAAGRDPGVVRDVARATAEEVAATGIHWVFSPNLDVVQDQRWGRTYETFGSDPKWVGVLGQAFIDGLQSFRQDGLGLAATAKHYIGNGSTEWGRSTNRDFLIDQGNTRISEDVLRRTHLEPFKQAVQKDVHFMMVGLNTWNGNKISSNKYLLTDVLRTEVGFRGVVVSDWYGVYENERSEYEALVMSINAGVDMVMLPFDYKSFADHMHQALLNGDINEARVDEAVRRIVTIKFNLGLFDHAETDGSRLNVIGSQPHREIARDAVRKSLVLLKNNKAVPLSKNTKQILVAGSAANNLGMQSGGWTVEWQGIDGNWIPGTTILKGIQDTVSPNTTVEYDPTGRFTGQKNIADVGIAVVGERPYAEGWGDEQDPTLSAEDIQTINRLQEVSKKIVVIIVSGRALNINAYAKNWDAIVAAWLPGSEGAGVADALFGDGAFTGMLPVRWEF